MQAAVLNQLDDGPRWLKRVLVLAILVLAFVAPLGAPQGVPVSSADTAQTLSTDFASVQVGGS